jgi:hypothetical protein
VGSKARTRSRVGPALYSVMEPGDEIEAGAWVRTGPRQSVDMAAALGMLAATVASQLLIRSSGDVHGNAVALFAYGLLPLATIATVLVPFFRKQVFVAVTRRQLICYRLTLSGRPKRLMFAVPLPSGPVRCEGWSMAYTGPDGRTIRFNAAWLWLQDLRAVVAALQASGSSIGAGPLPPMVSSGPGDPPR